MTSSSLMHVDVTLLQPNPFQPRNAIKPDDIEELATSIAIHGVLEPLVVADTPAGYQIIAGERRWRAAQKAGLSKIPVILKQVTSAQMLEMALIENVQRKDLNPLERAQAFQQLQRDFGMTIVEIARRIGKSPSYISNSLRLLELPDAIKDGISGSVISEGHARALAGITDQREMVEAYKELLRTEGTVRDAEDLARNWKDAQQLKHIKGVKRIVSKPKDPEVKAWQERLQDLIRKKTWVQSNIRLTRSTTQTKITITMKGSEMETQKALENFMQLASDTKSSIE